MKRDQEKESRLYFNITTHERESAIRYLLGAIIKTRNESEFPSNYYVFDEDVNIYLAHLLFAGSLPEYHEMAEPYLSLETTDVLRWVRSTEDRTIRYFIFKVNADHLLVHTSIFDDLNRRGGKNKLFRHSKKHFRELAKLYYDQAAAYHKRIYRKKTGVGDVLGKLSHYFEQYQSVLMDVRREYFHFVNNFRDQVFHQFLDQMSSYEHSIQKKKKMDQFLDLYGRWLETKDPALRDSIKRIVADLRALDSRFQFDPERELGSDEGEYRDERKCA